MALSIVTYNSVSAFGFSNPHHLCTQEYPIPFAFNLDW